MSALFTSDQYKAVAIAMEACTPHTPRDIFTHEATCRALAEVFAGQDEMFNRNIFLYQCGYKPINVKPQASKNYPWPANNKDTK